MKDNLKKKDESKYEDNPKTQKPTQILNEPIYKDSQKGKSIYKDSLKKKKLGKKYTKIFWIHNFLGPKYLWTKIFWPHKYLRTYLSFSTKIFWIQFCRPKIS